MNNIKFIEMRIGDHVEFLKAPCIGSPLKGVIQSLDKTHMTYSDGQKTEKLRRASLVLDRRDRRKSLWVFE